MSIYTNEVGASQLFERHAKQVGIDGITPAEVQRLSGIILDIAAQVGPKMAKIGVTFRQYTDHSLTHLINVAELIDKFLPDPKFSKIQQKHLVTT